MIIFPTCVVVFAQGSEIDWNLPPVSWIVSIVFRRSRVRRLLDRSSAKNNRCAVGGNEYSLHKELLNRMAHFCSRKSLNIHNRFKNKL
jgi:hypothetical protein